MASLVSRRKPLGDLSNSMKTDSPRISRDANKTKSISKASGKVKTAGRKPLSDISNSRKPESKKKSFNANLSVLKEEPDRTSAIAEETFLHNHEECIKAQARAMDSDEFLQSIGLKDDFPKKLAISCTPPPTITMKNLPRPLQLEAMTKYTVLLHEEQSWEYELDYLPRPLQLEAMTKYTVLLHEDQSWEYELDSPSPFKTPISPKQNMDGKDHDNCVDFKLIETT